MGPITILILITVIIVIGIWTHLGYERANEASAEQDEEKRLNKYRYATGQLVRAYESTLYAKKLQTIRRDAYGNIFDDAWEKEKAYFHEFVVKPGLGIAQGLDVKNLYPYETSPTSDIIEEVTDDFARSHPVQGFDVSSLTPYEFEAFCTELLNDSGWSARTTKGSGDQGIDIIGEKNGLKAVFQVKQYSSPVGNKAVQEAIAGKAFALADLAFVVSNAGFTPSAIELASVSGVRLLHYSELSALTTSR